MGTTMYQRHTLVDAFTPVNDDKTNQALQSARESIGEAAWKEGYSKDRSKAVNAALTEHGAAVKTALEGRLESVSHVQTTSGANTFDKLRVTLAQDNGDKVILTGDMRSEFSQRLLAKLDTATQGTERHVSIGGFAEAVERNGKTFVNHVATLKNEHGEEIKAAPGHFGKAAERGQAAADALEKAGMRSPKLLLDAKAAARTDHFTELAGQIHTRLLKEQKIETIEQTGQVTGRFVSASEPDAGRVQITMQRAGSPVIVDVPAQALPPDIAPGTPMKLRFDKHNGVTAEVGKPAQDPSKSHGI